jgi:lactose/L-arabinose transport system substrate-binding protein
MLKRRIIERVILIAIGVVLYGCVGAPTAHDTTPLYEPNRSAVAGDLHIWSWNIAAEALKAISPAYEATYPHVKVNVDMTGADMTMRFMLSLAAGTGAPDVSQLQMTDVPRYIATGCLTDLTPVAAKYKNSFPPSLWKTCVSHGKVYAIPWDMGPCAVFYKRAIFAKYGVDPDSIKTWDDFIKVGEMIQQKSGGKTKMMPLASGDIAAFFSIILEQAGGQVFDAEGRIAVDSTQGGQALAVLRKLIRSGICLNVGMYTPEWMAGMNDDSVATYPGAVWLGGMMADSVTDGPGKNKVFGVFRLPAVVPGGLRVANQGGSVLVIPLQSKQREAAWSFIEYALCTQAGQNEQFAKKSLFPSYLPAIRGKVVSAPEVFYGNERAGAVFAEDVTKIPHTNMTPQWQEAQDYVYQDLTHWEATGMNDPHVLKNLAQKLSQRLGQPIAPGDYR